MAIELAKDGKSDYVIVIADKAGNPVKHAAKELQTHLKLVTGAELQIVTNSEAKSDSPQILVGVFPRARQLAGNVNWDSLEHDGIVIKTVGDTLILAGGKPRGTIYAVNTFLEDHVGVRWWTSSEMDVPNKPTLELEPLDIVYVPRLRYREAYYADAIKKNALHASRLKLNGHMTDIPPRLGGHYTLIGWCHTFYALIPPNKHFAQNPEWFSEHNGKRVIGGGQLCLTNEAMRQELVNNALQWIRSQPDAGMISISQNDWQGPCQCKNCAAVVEEEGSQSGPLIRFINAVAADIAKEYPDFLVETLAYQYTRKPPAKVKPADNVIVRLCSIECDFVNPLSGPTNPAFGDDLRGWAKISPKLFIWNYVTNFSNYLIPHPNMRPLADDIRFFIDHQVVGLFEQGDAFNATGDFVQLRTWLLAKLMWDPSRDEHALRREFLDGYYGPAGKHLAEYLDLIHVAAARPGFTLGTYHDNTGFVSPEQWRRAAELFDRAEQTVADDPVKLERVRRERLILDHVELRHYDFDQRLAEVKAKWPDRATDIAFVTSEYDEKVERFVAAARKHGIRNYSEGASFDSYEPSLRTRSAAKIPPKLPKQGESLPAGHYDIPAARLGLHRIGELTALVDDPRASTGKAARMTGNHTEWAVQYHVKKDDPFIGDGLWRCYFVVRTELRGDAPSGGAFNFGIHDPSNHTYVARDGVSVHGGKDGEYHVYGLAVRNLRPGMYFWLAPVANGQNVEALYIDRIYLIRDDAKE